MLTTVRGQWHALSWYLGSDGEIPNDLDAEINAVTLFSQIDFPSTAGSYNLYTVVNPRCAAAVGITGFLTKHITPSDFCNEIAP